MVESYLIMDYDAVGVSTNDLSLGIDFFRRTQNDGFPWLSANVSTENTEEFFQAHLIKKVAGLTIGIIGITGGAGKSDHQFSIADWQAPLKEEIELLKGQCDLLILLSTLNKSESKDLQVNFPELDIIVSSDRQGKNSKPMAVNGKLFVQGGQKGKYIGKLDVTYHSQGDWNIASRQSKRQLLNSLRAIDTKIQNQKEQQRLTGKSHAPTIAQLEAARQKVAFKLERLSQPSQSGHDVEQDIPGKQYKSTFLSVKPRRPGNSASKQGANSKTGIEDQVDARVLDINQSIQVYNQYRRKNLQQSPEKIEQFLQSDKISGSSECITCHEAQATFWETTGHSQAYTTLSEHGQAFNLQCLPCHVTGGRISENSTDEEKLYLLVLPGDRQTIGCEVCHGPATKHIEAPEQVLPRRLPPESLCKECHTPARDDNFSYQEKLMLIACPAS